MDAYSVPLVTSSTTLPVENFWAAVLVYYTRPHLVNRKIAAVSRPCFFCKVATEDENKIRDFLHEIDTFPSFTHIDDKAFIEKITENLTVSESSLERFKSSPSGVFVALRTMFGRAKSATKCREFVILDKTDLSASFHAIHGDSQYPLAPNFPYRLELSSGNLRIVLGSFDDAETSSAAWLAEKLFPKLLKFSENSEKSSEIGSLDLVEADQYCLLYTRLKRKYGDGLVKAWPSKANTDPAKYVFEDLAIAAYLISLWNKLGQGKDSVRFVDCGCGNGLLVHVLGQEGYSGLGLDVRSRQTWELFAEAELNVEAVTPSSLFPAATWIIGNHSDELTPWIPVIALRSSPETNFFVLPCCPYDFNGKKYLRANTAISQYSDYLNYVQRVSDICGFDTKIDKLRIPSTKRTCLVGLRRKTSDFCKHNAEITQFINSRDRSQVVTLRNPVEKVRNCTQLNRDLIKRILTAIVNALLKTENVTAKNAEGEDWNQGAAISLASLIEIVPQQDLKQLKNECGGLQTLLKNHGYIFQVKNGTVSLKKPLELSEKTAKYREKPCWFHENHPNGCLFTQTTCSSKH